MSEKTITIAGQAFELAVTKKGSAITAGAHSIEILAVDDGLAELVIDGRRVHVPFHIDGGAVSFLLDGETWLADVSDRGARTRARHKDHSMEAPMPGMITKILVQAGQTVGKGTPLLILEAMKMEHSIVAPRDGSVAAIRCREGELVQPGVELVEFV